MLGSTNSTSKLIKNLDVTLTENGTFVSGEDYTGFGIVTVDVAPAIDPNPLQITPSVVGAGEFDAWDEYSAPFIDKTGTVYEGVGTVRVKKIGAWIDSEITADNIREGHSILGVAGIVKQLIPEERLIEPKTYEQIIYPNSPATGITKITVRKLNYQSKTVNPTLNLQTVRANSDYDALDSVTINPISIDYLKEQEPELVPENIKKGVEIFDITGTYEPEPDIESLTVNPRLYKQTFNDVSVDGYKPVVVNAVTAAIDPQIKPENIKKNINILDVIGTYEPITEGLQVTPTIENQIFKPAKGVDGFNEVNVERVTASIDRNIIPSNIKRDVEILGVTGTYTTENLQNKTVDPKEYIQTVTYDSTLGYDGLDTVTVNAVTASIDSAITAENIKKGVEILGVEGTFEGRQPVIQQAVSVEPKTLPQSVKPNEGYDGLSEVNIAAVTAAIDPNILAENIKKNINILGVTGSYESIQNNQPEKIVNPSASGDIVVTPDSTYDALLKVIVKAVTASIDPNIIPKNIRKNVNILGVIGALEEGGEQKWFDFSGISNYIPVNQDTYGEGGYESILKYSSETNYQLKSFVNDTFPSISSISGVMFTQVYGYDNEEAEYNELEQVFINFIDGLLYDDYDDEIVISDQKRYFYPFTNEYGVKGLTIGLDEDDGSERIMNLYVLTDTTHTAAPVPVLVNGTLSASMLPVGFDGFRFVKEIAIPAHEIFTPKNIEGDTRWYLRDRDAINTEFVETMKLEPDPVYTSAYNTNYGEEDTEVNVLDHYRVKHGENVLMNNNVAKMRKDDLEGYVSIPESFEKQDKCYYYFKFKTNAYYGSSSYYTIAHCPGLFVIYVYRYGTNDYWRLGWRSAWDGVDAGPQNNSSSATMYNGIIYYVRVYVNGSSTNIQWSNDGYKWTNIANVSNATYINPTNSNKLKLYVNNEPQIELYPEGCYVEKDGVKIYEYFEPVYRKESTQCVIPLKTDNLFVSRDLNRVSPYYKNNEIINYEKYNPDTRIMKLGTFGCINIKEGFNIGSKNTWEIGMHVRIPKIIDGSRHLLMWLGGSTSYRSCLWIDTSNKMNLRIYSDSGRSTLVNGTVGNYSFIASQEYYIVVKFTGIAYYCIASLSPDMSDPVVSYVLNTETKAYTSTQYLIYGNYTETNDHHGADEIFLDEHSYVKVNDQYIWKCINSEYDGSIVDFADTGDAVTINAYLAEKQDKKLKLRDLDCFGNLNINENGAVNGFTFTNYLRTKTKFFPQNKPWEITAKIRLDQLDSNGDVYLLGSTNYDRSFLLGVVANKFTMWISSSRTSWDITDNNSSGSITAELGVEYFWRFSYDLSTYLFEVSTDGEIWSTAASVNSTKPMYQNTYIYIGSSWDPGTKYLRGAFYPEEFSIKIDGNETIDPIILENEDNYTYIFSNNNNWTSEGLINKGLIGTVNIPRHSLYLFDYEKMIWESSKSFIFNVTDVDAILYTEINEGE